MSSRVPSYLRTRRRQWGLTQRELAQLLGAKSRAQVSRLERDERLPSVRTLIACLIIFGGSTVELFPHLYAEVEEGVLRNAAGLREALKADSTLRGVRKHELLQSMLARAITSSHKKGV